MTWATFWDAFTAVGTVAMAITTALIIRQNRRQHQDAFRPVCVLVPDAGLEQFARAKIVHHDEEPDKATQQYRIECGVKNVGGGPALHLRLFIRFPMTSVSKVVEPTLELPPLAAGQQLASPIRLPVRLHDGFNSSDFQFAADMAWELWLEYQDMFGQVFYTLHSKEPLGPWGRLIDSEGRSHGR